MSSVQQTIASGQQPLHFERMQADDLDEVLSIESAVYSHPWTRGNFLDSLYNGYETWVARDARRTMVGYFLMMLALDEAHLLNISVHANLQGRGIGRRLLDKVCELAREQGIPSILLEVRPSNLRALAIYKQYGFSRIGIRKNYYPAAQNVREDAIVMRLSL